MVCAIGSDHAKPGKEFLRIANTPAHLPSFDQRILHDVFGFIAILQKCHKRSQKVFDCVCTNDHLECFSTAVNGGRVLVAFRGIPFVAISSLDT